jgi:hypothetical protein
MATWDELNKLLRETTRSKMPKCTEEAERKLASMSFAGMKEHHPEPTAVLLVAFRDATLAAHSLRMSILPRKGDLKGEWGDKRINADDVSFGMLAVASRLLDLFGGNVANTEFRWLAKNCACYPIPVT